MLYFAVLIHYTPEALAAVEVPEPPPGEPYLEAQVAYLPVLVVVSGLEVVGVRRAVLSQSPGSSPASPGMHACLENGAYSSELFNMLNVN